MKERIIIHYYSFILLFYLSPVSLMSSSDFGDLVLIVGDAHVPHRKDDLPSQFRDLFSLISSGQTRLAHILVTGNSGSASITNYFKSLSLSTIFTRGDQDFTTETAKDVKETVQIKLNKEFSLGMCHGHTICPWGDQKQLESLQRQLDVDILVSGHTHQPGVWIAEESGKLFLNPGSVSGAYSSFTTEVTPSFILLALKASSIQIFLYQLIGNEVKVTKTEYNKTKK